MAKKIDYELLLSKDRGTVKVIFSMSGISKSLVSKIIKKSSRKMSKALNKDLSYKEAVDYVENRRVLELAKESFWLLDKALVRQKARALRLLRVNHLLDSRTLVIKRATLFREPSGFSVVIDYEGVCFDV